MIKNGHLGVRFFTVFNAEFDKSYNIVYNTMLEIN